MALSTTLTVRIDADNLAKRFAGPWVVKDFSHTFASGSATAIAGPNGSGKSTLMKMLAGQLMPSAGNLKFSFEDKVKGGKSLSIASDELYQHVSFAAPYVELIEELSGKEAVAFHAQMRSFRQNLTQATIWERLDFKKRTQRQTVASYSSGMKQRLKLVLALATESDLVLLDEPTTNLDLAGVNWYEQLVSDWLGERTLIIASNEERDFVQCQARVEAGSWEASI